MNNGDELKVVEFNAQWGSGGSRLHPVVTSCLKQAHSYHYFE
jgi:hypothetical protein